MKTLDEAVNIVATKLHKSHLIGFTTLYVESEINLLSAIYNVQHKEVHIKIAKAFIDLLEAN